MHAPAVDDLTRALDAALGPIGKQLAEVREESKARAAELDAKIATLSTSGTEGKVRSRFFAGLQSGDPSKMPALRADESVEQRLDRARSTAGTSFIRLNGERVPLIHSLPRGSAGIQDGRGLLPMRIMRAVALCVAHEQRITPENALGMAARFFGSNDDAAGYLEEARDLIAKHGSADEKERALAERALGTSVLGAGAGFVSPSLWGGFFDYVFPKSILRRLGAGPMPLEQGMIFTFFDTAVTAAYVGDNDGVREGSPGEGQFQINGRTLQVICALANKLLESPLYSVDAILRQHMGGAMAAKGDLMGIEGRGTSFQPHGLDYWVEQPTTAHYANRTLVSSAVTYDSINRDVFTALEVITNEGQEMAISPLTDEDSGVLPGIILTNRDAIGLMRIKVGTDDHYPLREEMRGGTAFGMKWGASTQTTKVLAGDGAGSGTVNKANVYVGNFANLKEAMNDSMKLEAFRGGAYKDANGNQVSGITNRETVFEGHVEHEWVELQRGKSFYRIGSVDWGVAF
jgi:hypothetical protein